MVLGSFYGLEKEIKIIRTFTNKKVFITNIYKKNTKRKQNIKTCYGKPDEPKFFALKQIFKGIVTNNEKIFVHLICKSAFIQKFRFDVWFAQANVNIT
jgi:hypothetical protein